MKGLFCAMLVTAVCGVGMAALSGAQTVTVPGTSNIFGAGHAAAPSPGGGSGGTLPPVMNVTGGSLLTILASGQVTLDNVPSHNKPSNGPDGGTNYTLTNVSATGGISGISDNTRTMFLVGVFLNATEPSGAAPASLTYDLTTSSLTSYFPMLDQTFFIGDGLTGTGTGDDQVFTAPAGATRLFLGFADSFNGSSQTITGLPGFYNDNGGTLSVTITAVPEPSAGFAVFGGLALVGLVGFRERRRVRG